MTRQEANQAMKDWLAERPESVQRLADKFPPGSTVNVNDEEVHIVGYTEGNELIVSKIDPYLDYNASMASRETICADCVKKYEH